jgi:putative hemolysin
MSTKNISIFLFVLVLCLAGCTTAPTPAQPSAEAGMPNPASVYCEEQGGRLEIRTGDDGGQYGVCVFADDSECEEWDFFYGKCAPKETEIIGMPNPASVYCQDQGGNSEIRTEDDGGQYGVCVFPDGSECDEWAFFRGECAPVETGIIGMPNPASVYCLDQGGNSEIRTDDEGGQYGVCVFPDNSECDEWALFRGECKPGE